MKVYGEFIEENGLQFRTKTLLQFGDSWDLIGSIIMKNPGSALPLKPIQNDDIIRINKFYSNNEALDNWFEFKADNTMKKIEPIFNGKYIGEEIKLNGIIQIFNLFNIREKDISIAKNLANNCISEFLYPNISDTINLFQKKPVYLGFHWEYVKKDRDNSTYKLNVNNFALKIFDHIKQNKNMYLNNDIIDNYFYHPLSPQITNEKYLPTLEKFFKLFKN